MRGYGKMQMQWVGKVGEAAEAPAPYRAPGPQVRTFDLVFTAALSLRHAATHINETAPAYMSSREWHRSVLSGLETALTNLHTQLAHLRSELHVYGRPR